MGRYSRKDMIEFANFVKSYQSSRKVSEAYQAYLKGARQITRKEESLLTKIMNAELVFLDGDCVKSRCTNYIVKELDIHKLNKFYIDSEDNKLKIIYLKTK